MVKVGEKHYLTPEELVARWSDRISLGTLANWRSQEKGPRHVNLGGILYALDEVEKYEAMNLTTSG